MLAAIGSTRIAAVCAPCSDNADVERADVVVRNHDRVGDGARGDARRSREAERRDAAPGLDEQRVEMAVIAAGELHDLVAPGRAAGQAHRRHRGFGPRRDEPRLFDRRHPRADRLDELDLARGRRAVRRAVGRGLLHGLDDLRVRVAEDRRAPRLHVVEVLAARRCRRSGCPRRATKNGSPPTDPNARTGELTPPGMPAWARANQLGFTSGTAGLRRTRARSR